MSLINKFECDMITYFCHYLLTQNYKPEQITILTLYAAQSLEIKSSITEYEKAFLKPIRVFTVDNYQGEENDIIILSLVRSNNENKIGFLKIPNRVNVALSRAKKGMYIFGNS